MSQDKVNGEIITKGDSTKMAKDISWECLIRDAELEIRLAKERITKLKKIGSLFRRTAGGWKALPSRAEVIFVQTNEFLCR